MRRTLFFDTALLPNGWARDVRLESRRGRYSFGFN